MVLTIISGSHDVGHLLNIEIISCDARKLQTVDVLCFKFTPSESMKGDEEVGGLFEL